MPPVLLSGHHENIAKWRLGQQLLRTKNRRPDMMEKRELTKEEAALLKKAEQEEAARILGSESPQGA